MNTPVSKMTIEQVEYAIVSLKLWLKSHAKFGQTYEVVEIAGNLEMLEVILTLKKQVADLQYKIDHMPLQGC